MVRTYGNAGGSLSNAGWASSAGAAAAGQAGERATAHLLSRQPDNRVVMHDLRMPIPGLNLNIDHVVIAGRTVALIDSKCWKPGFYLTLGGRTFRGRHTASHVDKQTMVMAVSDEVADHERPAASHVDKQTMVMARESIGAYLTRRGCAAELPAVVAVWPSNQHKLLRLWAARMPGADLIQATKLPRWLDRHLPNKPADPEIVAAMAGLVR